MLNRRSSSRSNCVKRSTRLVKLLVSWILKICWERSSANSASENETADSSTRSSRNRSVKPQITPITQIILVHGVFWDRRAPRRYRSTHQTCRMRIFADKQEFEPLQNLFHGF